MCSRRRRAYGAAGGLGRQPRASSLARMKASMGLRTQAVSFTAGTATGRTGRKAQWARSVGLTRASYFARGSSPQAPAGRATRRKAARGGLRGRAVPRGRVGGSDGTACGRTRHVVPWGPLPRAETQPMAPDLDGLLQSCKGAPDEVAPRLILADWLEEHGEADRAEFVRLGCSLDRSLEPLPEYEPDHAA